MLDEETFRTVVESTPLISIDLVVRDPEGKVLLGKRLNRPAQGYWFVPGGRVLKDETISSAFSRLTFNELGIDIPISSASYLGLYEHLYEDSALDKCVTTHYVVNAFEIKLNTPLKNLPEAQHSEYRWITESDLLGSPDVHLHSQWYFMDDMGYKL